MSLEVQNTSELLNVAISNELYKALIVQLNKDFKLSNIEGLINVTVSPDVLKQQLLTLVEQLIYNEFDGFLNLLYRIDISEQKIKKHSSQTTEEYIENVSFLILKREWQKVWFRQNYSS